MLLNEKFNNLLIKLDSFRRKELRKNQITNGGVKIIATYSFASRINRKTIPNNQ